MTIGTTMQVEITITFFKMLLSLFTKKRKATPLAGPDTTNQSIQKANTTAIGNPSHPSRSTSVLKPPI